MNITNESLIYTPLNLKKKTYSRKKKQSDTLITI